MTSRIVLFLVIALSAISLSSAASTPIRGDQKVGPEQMYQYVASRNPEFPREVALAFYEVGEVYGIRGDIALCQAIVETGWFRFDNGTAVSPSDHNYCGLGVKKRGNRGCRFGSIREGVTAMIQHLYAYACKDDIPSGESILDPRFKLVSRGSAKTWESLSGRWAMNSKYGKQILDIYQRMLSHSQAEQLRINVIEVEIPDHLLAEEDD